MPDQDLSPLDLAWLAKENAVRSADPCRVCGAEMAPGRMGPGGTIYHCASDAAQFLGKDGDERRAAEQHYRDSEQTIYSHGDSRVLALIEEVRRRRAEAGDPALPEVGEMYDPHARAVPGDRVPDYRYLGDDQFGWVHDDGTVTPVR